jgi:hypothetical protein
MLVLTPKYKKHSEYRGATIFKRLPNSGTHGGMWMVRSTTFKTLSSAKCYVDYLALHNNL